jgi:hypothetical protein
MTWTLKDKEQAQISKLEKIGNFYFGLTTCVKNLVAKRKIDIIILKNKIKMMENDFS